VGSLAHVQVHALHHVHILLFAEVRTGLGMDMLHLGPDHPKRASLAATADSLKVSVFPCLYLYLSPPHSLSPRCDLYPFPSFLLFHAASLPDSSFLPRRRRQTSAARGQTVLALHYLVLLWWRRIRHHHAWLSALSPPIDVRTTPQNTPRAVEWVVDGQPFVFQQQQQQQQQQRA
jgi:hypothetical protein